MTENTVLETIENQAGVTRSVARRVMKLYESRTIRALKYNAHDGYQLVHGKFFDGDVILEAVKAYGLGDEFNSVGGPPRGATARLLRGRR